MSSSLAPWSLGVLVAAAAVWEALLRTRIAFIIILTIMSWLFAVLTIIGIGYTMYAAVIVAELGRQSATLGISESVSLLKPLHGAEPKLADNLATFLNQVWDAPIQMVVGVQRPDDPALPSIPWSHHPARQISVVRGAVSSGPNAKVGNLIGMLPFADYDLLVLSDSDMAVPRDYLTVVAGALNEPGVGAVTCLYRGRGDAGHWSVLAAAAISYQFLPSVVLGLRLKVAEPCMGSTIALRRETLARIGGFEALSDRLADDYEIGAAVRALDLKIAVPPLILTHGCAEDGFAALWRQERRWAATVRLIDPVGHAGSIITYPLPTALLLTTLTPLFGLVLLTLTLLARFYLKRVVDQTTGVSTAPGWMMPLRDCLSFVIFIASFATRSIDWRGTKLRMGTNGRIATETESPR